MDWETRLKALLDAVAPDVGNLESAVSAIQTDLNVNHQWIQITQAAYDALGTKDPDVLYVIIG